METPADLSAFWAAMPRCSSSSTGPSVIELPLYLGLRDRRGGGRRMRPCAGFLLCRPGQFNPRSLLPLNHGENLQPGLCLRDPSGQDCSSGFLVRQFGGATPMHVDDVMRERLDV